MNKIDEIIGLLLLRHSCVIIPGFGGFIAKHKPAEIDYVNGIMTPPRKSLLFNKQLISNDGLLVAEYAKSNGLTFDQAEHAVQQAVNEWNKTLSEGSRISIDKVGFLFLDTERNICFEQDREFNLLLSSFGLDKVHFLTQTDVEIVQNRIEVAQQPVIPTATYSSQPELIEKTVEQQEVISTEKVEEPAIISIHKSKRSIWKYVAAACLIPMMFYSFWIPLKTDVLESKMISFHDFNPFHEYEKSEYKPVSHTKALSKESKTIKALEEQLAEVETANDQTYSYNLTDNTFLLVEIKQAETETISNSTSEVASKQIGTSQVSTGAFNYIIGCFSSDENAQNLVKELKEKGFNASIVDKKNGLNRVSIGSANTQVELNQLIEKSKSHGFEGWVLK
ncbi:MAG TPA: SPOR domain-containing protein [Taishania sp.]|nr:SPOR domain-containing protein [Taishania sp.]